MADAPVLTVGHGCALCEPAGEVNGRPFLVCTEKCTEEMRALTVKQPWAHMIASRGKTVENRIWPTDYRGLLAIHAGAYSGWDRDAESSPVALEAWKRTAGTDAAGNARTPLTRGEAASFLAFGAVIAVAELSGCHDGRDCSDVALPPRYCSPWAAAGQWHWQLACIQPLAEPVRVRGMLGLWRLPEDVEKAVRAQLEVHDA